MAASAAGSSSAVGAGSKPAKALQRGEIWGLPGVCDVSVEVQNPTDMSWTDSRENPPIRHKFHTSYVQRNLRLQELGVTCTLGADERYRLRLMPLQGVPLIAKITVDTVPVYSTGCCMIVPAGGCTVEGFVDQALGTTVPFILKELEVVEGNSLRCFELGRNAMAKVGRVDLSFFKAEPEEAKTYTSAVLPSAGGLQTSEKKALLNGLGTSAPSFAAGSVTYTSAPWRSGDSLGSFTIPYRDRSAVVLWCVPIPLLALPGLSSLTLTTQSISSTQCQAGKGGGGRRARGARRRPWLQAGANLGVCARFCVLVVGVVGFASKNLSFPFLYTQRAHRLHT